MRVDKVTLDRMREAIAPLDTSQTRERYRAGDFPRADAVKDLDMRYRWDLWWAAGGYRLLPSGHGLESAHVDTALRRIVPNLTGDEA